MTDTDAARTQILGAIRMHLAASAAHDAVERARPPKRTPLPVLGAAHSSTSLEPPLPPFASESTAARFTARLAAAGGQWTAVRGEADAARALAQILTGAGARRVAGSDAPVIQRLLQGLGDAFVVRSIEGLSRDELFACDAGVTTAQWGVAETGSLVLESAREQSRLLSLVPPIHVALLPAHRIIDSLEDALTRVRQADLSPAVTLITGPSRTSDIELTLVVGVHGPQVVHVVLLEED